MGRKGRLEEFFSKALHADNSKLYSVVYRDFESLVEVTLDEFLVLSQDFAVIPASRIFRVRRGGTILYEKATI